MGLFDLFKPKWKHSNPEIRKTAVDELTDQTALMEVVKNEEDQEIRKSAARKLTDQAVLTGLAKNENQDVSVRRIAINKLTDQSVLAYLVKNSKFIYVQTEAEFRLAEVYVTELPDQASLMNAAENHENRMIRAEAVKKIKNHAHLVKIVKNTSEDCSVRCAAVDKLTDLDHSFLESLAANDKCSSVRESAVRKLTDQVILAGLAQNDHDWTVRAAATRKLSDQTILECVVGDDTDTYVRIEAIKKILNKVLLLQVLNNDRDPQVRQAAEYRLSEI